MGSQANWKEFTTEDTTKERRKGRRARLVFPIEVSGIDEAEGIFCERTFTNDISERGCSFHVSHSLQRGDMVAIKLLAGPDPHSPENKPLLFQICWIAQEKHGWMVGVLKLNGENFWPAVFPPDN
ncbi:MAG: hypothetical protein DMG28_11485 [Acidobacteria bacterium]|nr:MAG: hypothetical protein DMG28_11485 [Acidobacteriota bacterium]